MENKNILILSAGRRVELIKCFRKAAQNLKIKTKIVAVDLANNAPALFFADKKYQIPRIGDKEYLNSIIDICNKENIDLVIPTIDTELLVLSQNKKYIESKTKAKVLVSSEKVIKICRDKTNTQEFFEKNGFGVPKQIKKEDIEQNKVKFPVFIKPHDGSSSINTFKVNNVKELKFFYEYIENPIVQDYIVGEEYTIDCFLDFDSNIITVVPRKRIATRSGEIIKGKVIKQMEIIEDVKKVLNILKPIGQITIQCIKTNEGIKYLEINPRFGGGAPMSINAGADSCSNLYRLLNNELLEYNESYRDNIFFFRFDDAIMVNENMEIIND